MTSSKQLTLKQEKFVQEYLLSGNASQAYRAAYPKAKKWKDESVWRQAHYTIKLPHVSSRINSIKERIAKKLKKKYEVNEERLTIEYVRLAFLDFSIFFGAEGQLLHIHEMSDDAKASLAGMETVMAGAGDEVDYVKKIKTYDKLKALGDLAKHLGFFKEDNEQGLPTVVLHDPAHPNGEA